MGLQGTSSAAPRCRSTRRGRASLRDPRILRLDPPALQREPHNAAHAAPLFSSRCAHRQDPAQADKLLAIQRELDETKIVLVRITRTFHSETAPVAFGPSGAAAGRT